MTSTTRTPGKPAGFSIFTPHKSTAAGRMKPLPAAASKEKDRGRFKTTEKLLANKKGRAKPPYQLLPSDIMIITAKTEHTRVAI